MRRKAAFLERTAEISSVKKASALSKCENEDSVREDRPAIIVQGGRGCAEVGNCLHNEAENEKEKEMARIRGEIGVFARWKEKQKQKGLNSGDVE